MAIEEFEIAPTNQQSAGIQEFPIEEFPVEEVQPPAIQEFAIEEFPIDAPKEATFAEGVKLGVEEAIAPWWMDEEEIKRQKETSGVAGSIIGNIVGSLAAGAAAAKAGAMVGTAVMPGVGTVAGATIGTLAYAVYAGFGSEKVRSTQEGQEFNVARGIYEKPKTNQLELL
jgi:hypothetical protein